MPYTKETYIFFLGNLLLHSGKIVDAVGFLVRAKELCKDQGYTERAIVADIFLATCVGELDDIDNAKNIINDIIDNVEDKDMPYLLAQCYEELAWLYTKSATFEEVLVVCEKYETIDLHYRSFGLEIFHAIALEMVGRRDESMELITTLNSSSTTIGVKTAYEFICKEDKYDKMKYLREVYESSDSSRLSKVVLSVLISLYKNEEMYKEIVELTC